MDINAILAAIGAGNYQPAPMPMPGAIGSGSFIDSLMRSYQPAPMPNPIYGGSGQPAPMPNPIVGGPGATFDTGMYRSPSPFPGLGNVPFVGGITGSGAEQRMDGSGPGSSGGAYGGGDPYMGDPNGFGGPPAGYNNVKPAPMPNPIVGGSTPPRPGGGYQPAPMPNPIVGGSTPPRMPGRGQPAPMPNPIVGGSTPPRGWTQGKHLGWQNQNPGKMTPMGSSGAGFGGVPRIRY